MNGRYYGGCKFQITVKGQDSTGWTVMSVKGSHDHDLYPGVGVSKGATSTVPAPVTSKLSNSLPPNRLPVPNHQPLTLLESWLDSDFQPHPLKKFSKIFERDEIDSPYSFLTLEPTELLGYLQIFEEIEEKDKLRLIAKIEKVRRGEVDFNFGEGVKVDRDQLLLQAQS